VDLLPLALVCRKTSRVGHTHLPFLHCLWRDYLSEDNCNVKNFVSSRMG
jgi:hypothetical protein